MAKEIVDYGYSRRISAIFVVVLISFIAYGLFQLFTNSSSSELIFAIYTVNSLILAIMSIIFGLGAKRAINYVPGKWEHVKKWVSFSEYDEIVEKYEKAYGNLFASTGDQNLCCCFFAPLLFALAFFSVFYQEFVGPMFGYTLDSILTVPLLYGIIGFAGFLIGYRSFIGASSFSSVYFYFWFLCSGSE